MQHELNIRLDACLARDLPGLHRDMVELQPADLTFFHLTLRKYGGLLKSIRRTFEVLRSEDKTLILLAEALITLGDRFAIYGFSGWTCKRCEVYPIKRFDQAYADDAKARICAVAPKDYTRMGAPIRHLTGLLKGQAARTKLLITLSDGKPDDYDPQYRGEYGIEDTRQALFEARLEGVHRFCVTIDEQGADDLPYMYGAANYTVVADVARLPGKVSEIDRRVAF